MVEAISVISSSKNRNGDREVKPLLVFVNKENDSIMDAESIQTPRTIEKDEETTTPE